MIGALEWPNVRDVKGDAFALLRATLLDTTFSKLTISHVEFSRVHFSFLFRSHTTNFRGGGHYIS